MRAVVVLLLIIGAVGAYFVLGGESGTSDQRLPGEYPVVSQDATSSKERAAQKQSERPEVSKTGPYPSLVAEEKQYLFGRMEIDEEGEHRFEIRNEGEAVLELSTGKSTCQCTKFELESRRVEPGESTWLTVRWKAKTRDNSFRHGGDVYTNDPENEALLFTVEGAVDAPVEMLPLKIWDVGAVYADRPGIMSAGLGSRIYDDFTIESIAYESEFVEVNAVPMTADVLKDNNYLTGYELKIRVAPEIPSGRFSADVTINVSCAKIPLVATIQAVKRGTIQVLPAPGTIFAPDEMMVRLGHFRASAGRSVKLQLIVNEKGMDEPFQITSVNAEPSFVQATLEPISEPANDVGRYWLHLKIDAGKPRVSYNSDSPARIEIETNHPTDSQIVLAMEMSSS